MYLEDIHGSVTNIFQMTNAYYQKKIMHELKGIRESHVFTCKKLQKVH